MLVVLVDHSMAVVCFASYPDEMKLEIGTVMVDLEGSC